MIDVNDFLQPISSESECGQYLGYDYIYDQIRECIREDDPQLSQGVWQMEIKKADWTRATEIICDLLKNKTKDLQLLVWLTESLAAQHGLPGLSNGIDITLAVAKKFWHAIHPLTNDKNHKMMPFFYLEEKISKRLVLLPITEPLDNEVGAFSLSDWLTAQYNFKIKNRKGLSLDKVRKNLSATSTNFLQNQKDNVKQVIMRINELIVFLNKSEAESPSFKNPLNYLNTMESLSDQALGKIQTTQKVENTITINNEKPSTPIHEKNIQSKEEVTVENVYTTLDKIAIFLEEKQPQSPVSVLLKIASVIGKKSFQELLDINAKSNSTLMNTIFELHNILNAEKNTETKSDGQTLDEII